MKIFKALLLAVITCNQINAQETKSTEVVQEQPKKNKEWFNSISVRGYVQVRYNRLLETNPDLGCEQCDKSWGDNGGFFLRRARVVFSGQVYKNVYFYLQPDFATSASSTSLHFGQIRDAYFDIGFDSKNEYRLRVGQSKIPYGFENLQSSSNRLPLDRNDGINSAFANERDLGAFFMWAPERIRKVYSSVVKNNYKGSGDYGVFAFGAFNGQTANKPELNNNLHVVARVSYPFEIGDQLIEPGIQAYSGRWAMPSSSVNSGVTTTHDGNYTDQRAAASVIVYPKPFGFQAEYNIGKGPEFNKETNTIETKSLEGGYAMMSYRIQHNDQYIFPFARYQYYNGGKKHETDARSYKVNDVELGVEWQINKHLEVVAMYTISDRKYEDFKLRDNHQKGNLLRLQAQVNF
ncbi:porin [Myroides sp. JBRI-B21084]|uniref:porin n=1 Tax=Myroides sp. JBRI-B21084 TaxID=3119977 RepID=UPI0026E2BC9A|nr:porin [Paenimyroides cloacae]WKW47590.1 porin [Paenimyroides cloacae]